MQVGNEQHLFPSDREGPNITGRPKRQQKQPTWMKDYIM